jgi:hypothetical protein
VIQVLSELNKELDKMHRSSKQRVNLFEAEIYSCRMGADLSEKAQGPDSPI